MYVRTPSVHATSQNHPRLGSCTRGSCWDVRSCMCSECTEYPICRVLPSNLPCDSYRQGMRGRTCSLSECILTQTCSLCQAPSSSSCTQDMNRRISEMTRPMRRLRLPAVLAVSEKYALRATSFAPDDDVVFIVLSETKLCLPPYTCLGSVFATFFV